MMTCPDCGHRNEDDAPFCASCQAFLDWEETRTAARPAPAAPAPAPVTTPAPAAAPPPVASPGGAGGPDAVTVPAAPPAPGPEEPPSGAAPRRPDESPHGGSGGGPDHRPGPPSPVAPTDGPAPEPARRAAPSRRCAACGTDNPADRRLCARCGTLLEATRNRAASSRRRDGRALAAGSRPRHRTLPRPRLMLPVLVLVLAAVAWFARPHLPEVFAFARDRTSSPKPLHPAHKRASSQAPGHQAGAAFDGYSNRYWAPATHGTGAGQYLEADFDRPVRLRYLLLTTGVSEKKHEFLTQARPSDITVTLTTAQGSTTTRTLELADAPGGQKFTVPGSDVTRVRLTVKAAYGARQDRRTAVAEVEFFGRR